MFALSYVGADWIPWIVGLSIVSVVVLVLILVAPWKSVRAEHGLDEETETRLLLGEDPERVEQDLEAREAERRARVSELRPRDDL
jgi:hypothetical protein